LIFAPSQLPLDVDFGLSDRAELAGTKRKICTTRGFVMLFSVELLLEIEASTPEDAASLALLEARTATDRLTVAVYADEPASGRYWRRVVVDVGALESGAFEPSPSPSVSPEERCMKCGQAECEHSYNVREYGQENTPRGLTSI
jgi:hypothetical protein